MTKPAHAFPWDRGHVEDWTLALQRHWRGIEPLQPMDLVILEGWLRDALPAACEYNRFAIGASCNHDFEILGAACCSPDRKLAAEAAAAFVLGLRCMLGEEDPEAHGLPSLLRFFGGSEQLSSDYEPMRVRAVAGLRLGFPKDAVAQRVSGLYFATVAALFALAAAPGPDRVAHAAGHGGLFYGGPALPPVGGRSNHFGQVENEPAWCLLTGTKAQWAENRYTDALPFLRQLGDDFGLGEILRETYAAMAQGHTSHLIDGVLLGLARIRFQERQHFARWADGSVACWVERQPSHLSPSYVAWVWRPDTQSADVGFPFRADAKNRGKDNDYPLATCSETDGHLVIQGGNELASPVKLPDGAPLYHVVVRPDGPPALQESAGATIPPAAPIPGPTPESPALPAPAAKDGKKKGENPWTGWL